MAARVETIETIVTQTEVEALHLEQNLIKRHRPPYNVRLRDDKSFPYIAVTVEDDYPRVMFTRERHRRGVVYFGPYANAKKVRETLDVLNRVFRYRPCEGPQPGRRSGIPCLDFHIERCHAPCVGYISKEDYRELIDQVIEFLSGDDRPIRRRLGRADAGGGGRRAVRGRRALPQSAARDRAAVRAPGGRAEVDRHDRRDRRRGLGRARRRPGLPAARRADGRPVRVPPRERRGRGRRRRCSSSSASSTTAARRRSRRRSSFRTARATRRRSPSSSPTRRGSRVEVRVPERGEKRRLQELAQQNAALALESETFVAESKRARRVEALEELREALNLESLPLRIECFDISNIQGQEVVGSMVVFEDAVAKKSHYRKFTLRGVEGQDDFASMREVIARRFARLQADPGSDEWNESFAATPNLVVIDGGKGQLSAALEAMEELDLPRVAVIALAKRIEEVFVPGRPEPILLPSHTAGLQLLQRIRDEAHRFAITFHRQRRDTRRARVDVRPARGRRPGAPPRAAAAFRLGRARRRRVARGARGRARRAGADRAADLRAAAPDRRRVTTLPPVRRLAPLLSSRLRWPAAARRRRRADDHGRAAARSGLGGRRRQHALPGRRVGGRRQGRHGRRAPPGRRRVAARPDAAGQGVVPRADAARSRRSRRSPPSSSASTPLVESGLWVDGAELLEKGGGLTATRGTIYGAPSSALAHGKHLAVAYARTATAATAVARVFHVR